MAKAYDVCHGLLLFRWFTVLGSRSVGFLWFGERFTVLSFQCLWTGSVTYISSPRVVFGRVIPFPLAYLLLLQNFYLEAWIICILSIPLFGIVILHLLLSPTWVLRMVLLFLQMRADLAYSGLWISYTIIRWSQGSWLARTRVTSTLGSQLRPPARPLFTLWLAFSDVSFRLLILGAWSLQGTSRSPILMTWSGRSRIRFLAGLTVCFPLVGTSSSFAMCYPLWPCTYFTSSALL